MYDNTITASFITTLVDTANVVVLNNDRSLYEPFLKSAEEFCIENRVLMGGPVGLRLLINEPLDKDCYMWNLYAADTWNTARRLWEYIYTNTQSRHIDPQYVGLETNIRGREFTILIATRPCIKISALDEYRGIKLIEVMSPTYRPGYFTSREIGCISEEMMLIDVYRTLYSPHKIDEWSRAIYVEADLYRLVREYLSEKAAIIVSAGADDVDARRGTRNHMLLDNLIRDAPDFVLIGDFALEALGLEPAPTYLQFITNHTIDQVVTHMRALFREKLSYVRYHLNLATDFQTQKHTIYLHCKGSQIALCDVFNSSVFEMIPFWQYEETDSRVSDSYRGVQVANPWVLLRFKFIELWLLKLILNLKARKRDGSETRMHARIRTLLDSIDRLFDAKERLKRDAMSELFQLRNYIGVSTNEAVARKKMVISAGRGFRAPIMYPKIDAAPAPT